MIPRDPDSEIIVATEVTSGNVADGVAAMRLLREVLADADADERVEIYGDSSYGTAELVDHIESTHSENQARDQAEPAARAA